ncbi:MAG: hypothetical protein AAGA85_03790 [Bacteroidota bacterium]
MTPRIFTALVFVLTLALSACDTPSKMEEEVKLTIEASIIAGQPVSNIRVLREEGIQHTSRQTLVSDAKVKMLSMGKVYELDPIAGRTGYYHYQGDDLEIVEGREYFLWVEYGDEVAVTARIVGEAVPGAEMNSDKGPEYYVAKN